MGDIKAQADLARTIREVAGPYNDMTKTVVDMVASMRQSLENAEIVRQEQEKKAQRLGEINMSAVCTCATEAVCHLHGNMHAMQRALWMEQAYNEIVRLRNMVEDLDEKIAGPEPWELLDEALSEPCLCATNESGCPHCDAMEKVESAYATVRRRAEELELEVRELAND